MKEMITKWMKDYLKYFLVYRGGSSPGGFSDLQAIDINGNTIYMVPYFDWNYAPFSNRNIIITGASGAYGHGFVLGSGSTNQPTENDYQLENQITSGLSAGNPTIDTYLGSGHIIGNKYTYVLTNSTDSDITIREFGYHQAVSSSSSVGGYAASWNTSILGFRKLLELPVVVPANSSNIFIIDFKVPLLNENQSQS